MVAKSTLNQSKGFLSVQEQMNGQSGCGIHCGNNNETKAREIE